MRSLAASRAPTHRLAYVEAQDDPAALQSAYPMLTPVAYPDLVGALLGGALLLALAGWAMT
ncbi:hypothetical protein, partial [Candidatus Burkholderia verschuerenii]|uniref:hypothetical protein n=1 Tax=Candidatus Burkholderia verschuerenii TaxID=242163 RepID=UPI0012EE6421